MQGRRLIGRRVTRREFLAFSGGMLALVAAPHHTSHALSAGTNRQPTPEYLIMFSDPSAGTRSYRRHGIYHHIRSLPYTARAVLRGLGGQKRDGIRRQARLTLLRGREQEVVATGPWSDGPEYTMEISSDPGKDEPLVIAAEVRAKDTWVIARPVYVGAPLALHVPRWVAVGSQRFRRPELNYQGVGYVWWPGHTPQHSTTPYKPRAGGRFDYGDDPQDFYVQNMTGIAYRNEYYPEFNVSPAPGVEEENHLGAATFEMQYFKRDAKAPRGLKTGHFRDGPRNVGQVGFPCAGFVDDDDSCVICSAPGRVARVDLTGNVTTLVGWRLKENAITPMGGGWQDEHWDRFEFVGEIVDGAPWLHIWDVQRDPDNHHHLYIADVDHQAIRQFDLRTGKLTVFAGSGLGESGFRDGVGRQARFKNPRGIAFRNDKMYVGDAANNAIRVIDMRTREVTTLVRSAGVHNDHHHHFDGLEGVRNWCRDGSFGEARFMHPQHIRFTSDGCLITPMHHQLQLVEFNLETRQVRTLRESLPGPAWHDHDDTWFTLHIDDGTTGPVDTMYYTGWEHWTDRMYTRDGDEAGGPFARSWIMQHTRPAHDMGFDARPDHWQSPGYSQFAVVGRGAIWVGGVSGAGIFRITPARPGDPQSYDHRKYQRGLDLWWRAPTPLSPSLSLTHGPWGKNGFGEATIDDLGSKSLTDFADWIYNDKKRTDLSEDEIDDLHYFIQMESITAKGFS